MTSETDAPLATIEQLIATIHAGWTERGRKQLGSRLVEAFGV